MKKITVINTYKVELTPSEWTKFHNIPYGWNVKREGREIPILSELAWSHDRITGGYGGELEVLTEQEFNALVEYLKD